MKRDKEVQNFIDKYSRDHFKMSQSEARARGCCVFCKREIDVKTEFRDVLSRKEWDISQLCQACQDDVFGSA